jgi:hypothetical protein
MRNIEQPTLTAELMKVIDPKNIAGGTAYKVNTFRELVENVAKLSYLNKDYLLFYRGKETIIRIEQEILHSILQFIEEIICHNLNLITDLKS